MHHFSGTKTVFNFNSDLSGDVLIHNPDTELGWDEQTELAIPGEDLLAFIANFVRNARISQLEQCSDSEILGIRETPHV